MSQFEYPRPQLVRDNWINLNGKWRFRFDDEHVCRMPEGVTGWTHEINVPFAPETEMSGIQDTGFHRFCWYERDFEVASSCISARSIISPGCGSTASWWPSTRAATRRSRPTSPAP
jgi:hypothetical protein